MITSGANDYEFYCLLYRLEQVRYFNSEFLFQNIATE